MRREGSEATEKSTLAAALLFDQLLRSDVCGLSRRTFELSTEKSNSYSFRVFDFLKISKGYLDLQTAIAKSKNRNAKA